ncbi:MAG TPA: hypothetical protein VGB64_10480 [Actinomycetota bacterium]
MRATTDTAHRTIDLTTDSTPGMTRVASNRRALDAASRANAVAAFAATRRRRALRATADTAADAAMATGGLAIVNVALNLKLGLPGGAAGLAMGAALLGIGAAIALMRRGRRGGTDPATAAMPVRVIVLERPRPQTVIDLDVVQDAHHVA